MKKFSLFASALLLLSVMANATIRRVGFFGTPVVNVDYASLQAAHDAATAGDTIMMMPGSTVTATFTKPLVVIGPGYFLDPTNTSYPGSAGLQSNMNTNSLNGGGLTLQTGSTGSQILGCAVYAIGINAGVNNVLFKRCWVYWNLFFNGNSGGHTFQQCYLQILNLFTSSSFTVTNLSFISSVIETSPNFSGATTTGLFSNCIFGNGASLGAGAWQIQNSIGQGSFSGTNIVYNNNIGTSTQFPAGNGNQQNKPWASIFNLTGSYDGKYSLKAGSPAIGGGVGGIDAGIFGGTAPYHLSGIPSVPTIYAISSPQGTTPAGNSVQINLSTRSNN